MDQSLFQQAIKIQNSTAIDIKKNEKDYAFTFIYPPSQVLYPLREGIFDNKEIKEANLYIHIPYCTGRCTYCYFGCYPLEKAPISREDYVNTMVKEIELVSSKYGKVRISSVHFGGGTPTTLSNAQFDSIFNAIRKNFDVADKLEITVESSPETLTEEKLECLVKNGVNRLNIGIQTLNNDLLKSINRRHSADKAIAGIRLAKKVGINNINVDLIYGLYGQTIEDWTSTLESIFNEEVQSISTYRLRIHPSGNLKQQIVSFDETKVIEMYITMLNMMKERGYYQCSSHKFAQKVEFAQKQIINKRGIGKDMLIPLGMSAYGYIEDILFWNARTMDEYVEKINSGRLPYSIGYELDKTEEMAKVCVLGIHNVGGIKLKKFRDKFDIDIMNVYGDLIKKLESNDLIEIDEESIKPSLLGMVFADEIATQFYSKNVKEKLGDRKYGIFFDEILK